MAGIYIHIPFCRKACAYCDFHFSTNFNLKDEMVNCIIKEIDHRKNYLDTKDLKSIYFGGGTPSVLTDTELNRILEKIHLHYAVDTHSEITLEANPDDLDKNKLKALKSAGINRLSIGLQSFNEEELKWMNRSHTAMQSEDCVKRAQDLGFENISIDLIYGSKFQNETVWLHNLRKAIALDVQHISAYNLTIEEKTALGVLHKKGKEPAINDEFSSACFNSLIEETKKAGFIQYEISNFGKENFFAVHNTNYWKGELYIGIGPSAHSYDGTSRQWNVANNHTYIKSILENDIPFEKEILSLEEKFNEYLLTRLRTMWGVEFNYMEKNFPSEFTKHFLAQAQSFIDSKKMIRKENSFILTDEGMHFADRISSDLFK